MDSKRSGSKNLPRTSPSVPPPRACPELVEGLASKNLREPGAPGNGLEVRASSRERAGLLASCRWRGFFFLALFRFFSLILCNLFGPFNYLFGQGHATHCFQEIDYTHFRHSLASNSAYP